LSGAVVYSLLSSQQPQCLTLVPICLVHGHLDCRWVVTRGCLFGLLWR
jgi:hypothetical protein